MSPPEQETQKGERRKRTLWLLAGGAISLVLPLAGIIYMRWSDGSRLRGRGGRGDVFERREADQAKITPSQTAVARLGPPAPMPIGDVEQAASGSSLDFIKSNVELQKKITDTPKVATAAAAAAEPTALKASTVKPAKKAFAMPKLQPTRGFSNFKGARPDTKAGAQVQGSGPDMQELLKNLPPGAETNPELQKYLQK